MAMPQHSRAGGSSTAQRGSTTATSSQTTTIHSPSTRHQQPVLRLRGAMRSPGERSDRRIQWAEDVIDNEGLGRKSSKGMSLSLPPTTTSRARTISNMVQYAAFTTRQKPQSMIPQTRAPTHHPQTPTAATTVPLTLPAARGAPMLPTSTIMNTTPTESVTMAARQRSHGGRQARMRTRRFQSRKRPGQPRWGLC